VLFDLQIASTSFAEPLQKSDGTRRTPMQVEIACNLGSTWWNKGKPRYVRNTIQL